MAFVGTNAIFFALSLVGALVYSGQVSVVIQKLNELLYWKPGCNPIYSLGNVSLYYFTERGKAEAIRLMLEDQKVPYIETGFDTFVNPQQKHKYANEVGWQLFTQGTRQENQNEREPAIEFSQGKYIVRSKAILHYIGRSVGLDCDCKELEKCDMIASSIEDVYDELLRVDFTSEKREEYLKDISAWLIFFEKIASNHDPDTGDVYFSSGRLTWIDYFIFDLLERNCDLIDYHEGTQRLGVLNTTNCSDIFKLYPKVNGFFNYFKERVNIKSYILSETRPKFKFSH